MKPNASPSAHLCRFRPWFLRGGVMLGLILLLTGCVSLSEKDRRVLEQQSVSGFVQKKMQRSEPLTLAEIEELSKRNVPSALIVRYLDNTVMEYQLTTEDVLHLRQAGVSHEVIDFLLATPQMQPYTGGPRYYSPVVVHSYYPRTR